MRTLVVLNPAAGGGADERIRTAIADSFGADATVHETGEPDGLAERVGDALVAAADSGVELVVAAGGDGTVALVADAMLRRGLSERVVLGIIPAGTANVMARELGLPLEIEGAVDLLAGAHAERPIDAMEVDGRHFVNQIGIGLDAEMIQDTGTEAKQKYGRLAYIATLLGKLSGHRAHRYQFDIDGRRLRLRAGQVLLANVGAFGLRPFTWGYDIDVSDGTVNLCVFDVASMSGYLGLLAKAVLGRHGADSISRYFEVTDRVAIHTWIPLSVQADGEIIGTTPITVRVIPHAVRVVVPLQANPEGEGA